MAQSLCAQSVVVVHADQIFSTLDEKIIILNPRNGQYYGMTPVASSVWKLIQSPMTIEAVCQALIVEYEASAEQVQKDVMALLEDMMRENMIQVNNEACA